VKITAAKIFFTVSEHMHAQMHGGCMADFKRKSAVEGTRELPLIGLLRESAEDEVSRRETRELYRWIGILAGSSA